MFRKKKEEKLPRVALVKQRKVFEENRKGPKIEYYAELYLFSEDKWKHENTTTPHDDVNSLMYALRHEKHNPLILFGE